MIDNTKAQHQDAETSASPNPDAGARVGFCQECGSGLTADTLRRVGSGVFCGTCAAFHQTGTGWQNVHANNFNGRMGPIPAGPSSGGPNPVLAGLLGFIPGVGAMYNAQYAKGAMHLIVFVILVAISDNVNWVFWWLVWGWIFYQVFEAYHTARARRDSLPLPNPFGWNDLGERMGFGRNATPGTGAFGSSGSEAGTPGANWAGYVPPTPPPASSYAPYSPFAEHTSENPYAAPYATPGPRPVPPNPPPTSTPYVATFTGSAPLQPVPVPTPIVGARRFPVGALWLIILGMIFLMGNLLPELRLSGRWFAPLLLAALAFWSGFRRFEVWQSGRRAAWCSSSLSGAMTGPAVLLTVSALLALQTAHILPLHRSWPFLLVVWGSMLLIQRSAAPPVITEQYPVPEPVAPPVRSTSGTGSLGL